MMIHLLEIIILPYGTKRVANVDEETSFEKTLRRFPAELIPSLSSAGFRSTKSNGGT